MNFKKLSILSALISFTMSAHNIYACSSCGSSATVPLVLNQNENLKSYFGFSQNFSYMNYAGESGKTRTTNRALISRKTLTLAIGYRLTDDSFITLTGSLIQNEGPENLADNSKGNKMKYLFGDPIISGRYNIINMGIDNVYRPQVQLIGSYKPKFAKNMVDRDGGPVDTVGNGFHQVIGGIDFWWGMNLLQFGASQLVTYSFARNPDNTFWDGSVQEKRTRDLQYTTVLTIGHVIKPYKLSLQAGIILDYIGEEKIYLNNITTESKYTKTLSPAQSNSTFFLVKYNVTDLDTLRLSYTIGGAYDGKLGPFTNSNQTTSNSALVAYERTFF